MKRLTIIAAMGFASLGLCSFDKEQNASTPQQETKQEQIQSRDITAPDFTLSNYDGAEITLSDLAGKIVVLEWFNYECPFVKYHYDTKTTMRDLANEYADQAVVWLAVNSTKHLEVEKNKAFAQNYDLSYAILDDRSGDVGRAYGAERTPHMYVIDTNGRIAYEGAIDNAPLGKLPEGKKYINYVDQALAQMTQGKPVEITQTQPYGCSVKY